MASYYISHRGNSAIQQEVWLLTPAEAKATTQYLPCGKGSYWDTNLVKPLRRAVRAKAEQVRIYTAGFGTSELSNALFNSDIASTERAAY